MTYLLLLINRILKLYCFCALCSADPAMPLPWCTRNVLPTLVLGKGRSNMNLKPPSYTDHVTGIILSGGKNSRMGGRNKAFIEFEGERLIDRSVRLFQSLFDEVILITNSPQEYLDLGVALVTDIYQNKGALGGIHAGLFHATNEKVFFAACDMPFLNEALIKHMIDLSAEFDILVPQSPDGLQPLHAIYSRKCLPVIEKLFSQDRLKIIGFYPGYTIHKITADTLIQFDPEWRMFSNLNSLEEMGKIVPENNG